MRGQLAGPGLQITDGLAAKGCSRSTRSRFQSAVQQTINRIPCSQSGQSKTLGERQSSTPDAQDPSPGCTWVEDHASGVSVCGAPTKRVRTPFTRSREASHGSNPTGGRVPRTRKRAAKRRSGIQQAGGGPLAGNVGPPDDPDKWWPRKRRYEADPTPARRSLHRRRVSEMARGRRAGDGGGRSPRRELEDGLGGAGETEGSPTRHRCPDGCGRTRRATDQEQLEWGRRAWLWSTDPSTALQPSEPDPDPLPTAGA